MLFLVPDAPDPLAATPAPALPRTKSSWKFWVFWTIGLIPTFIFFFFFFVGLGDGTVSSFNIALWLAILGVLVAIVGGGLFLKLRGKDVAALVVACLLAIPSLLALLFFLVVITTVKRWN